MQKHTKLGWIGLGVMGEPMCRHLMSAGYEMSVYTRSAEKAKSVLAAGANWCESPVQLAKSSDVIFTMVGVEQEIREVYFADTGLLAADIKDKVFVDMGTTAPKLTIEIAAVARKNDAYSIDAPVSGGDVGAKNASLSIMAGGDEFIVQQLETLFTCMGRVQYMGPSASGQHTKMCNQIVVAGTMIGVCESLVYAKQAGLDCELLVSAISKGAAGCWTLENLAPRINKQDFEPGFMVNHFIKDLGIAVNEAQIMNLDLPGLSLAQSLYGKVSKMGFGENGTQALLLALEAEA